MARKLVHVDRAGLYTNLEERISYLHSFIDFNARDVEALQESGKYIRALIPAVVNIVYKKLLEFDITARAFTTRSTSYDGELDEIPTENSPQILYRKMFLRGYLHKLCADPTKIEFWQYLDKVGMMHVGLGRKHPLHVDYVHLGICLGYVQDILLEAILSHPRLAMDRKVAVVRALNKLMWIQNDLLAKWHVRDGDEFEKKRGDDSDSSDSLVIEREGYLHGKKMFEESDTDSAEAPSGCPFSGMAMPNVPLKDTEVAST